MRAIRVQLWPLLILTLTPRLGAQPLVDYHQHLFGPNIVKLAPDVEQVTARDLVALLDQAGIRRALVLSIAYQFSNPNKPPVENEYARVKEENDWTAAQAGQYPERLRALCSVNPLKDYALQEIARCANNPQLHFGLKLHFGNSDVDLDSAADVAKVRTIFRSANEHGMAIVVHMRPSVTRRRAYGAKEARAFLTEILPAAPDVPVQIAHLAGAGGYDDPAVDAAAAVFVEAVANHDTRMKHVYFDVSGVAGLGKWKEKAGVIAMRIRQLGVERLLFGSDGAGNGNLTPKEAWAAFRQLPLTQVEFHAIEQNITPYMR